MRLNEFIEDALSQIAEGVNGAKTKYKALGGDVNPRNIPFKSTDTVLNAYSERHQSSVSASLVTFEIALTSDESFDGQKGIGVFFGSVGLGVKTNEAVAEKSLNKISFTIPVLLP